MLRFLETITASRIFLAPSMPKYGLQLNVELYRSEDHGQSTEECDMKGKNVEDAVFAPGDELRRSVQLL